MTSGTGAATSSSSVPWFRCWSREKPEPTITCDQSIIIAAPSDATKRTRVLPSVPIR